MQWITDNIAGGVFYDLFRYYVLGPIIVSLLGTVILRYAFEKLRAKREIIIFSVGSFLVFVVLFFFIGTRPQQPNLIGSVQQVLTGQFPGSDHDTAAIFAVGIVNTGGMQSIVKNWHVDATANGVSYQGTFVQVPNTFTFNNIPRINDDQPEALTFKAEDNIVEKGLLPIQTGAFLQGTLFVVFRNVDASIFKGVVDYRVSYQDALSRDYSMPIKSKGQIDTIGLIAGLHTEAVCRMPQQAKAVPETTGAIPDAALPQLNFTPLPPK